MAADFENIAAKPLPATGTVLGRLDTRRADDLCGRAMSEPPPADLRAQVDAVYRTESRRVLATLIRLLGEGLTRYGR